MRRSRNTRSRSNPTIISKGDYVQWDAKTGKEPNLKRVNKVKSVVGGDVELIFPQNNSKSVTGTIKRKHVIKIVKK